MALEPVGCREQREDVAHKGSQIYLRAMMKKSEEIEQKKVRKAINGGA